MQPEFKNADEESIDIEKQAAEMVRSMQNVHGGVWEYAYDEDVGAMFIYKRFD